MHGLPRSARVAAQEALKQVPAAATCHDVSKRRSSCINRWWTMHVVSRRARFRSCQAVAGAVQSLAGMPQPSAMKKFTAAEPVLLFGARSRCRHLPGIENVVLRGGKGHPDESPHFRAWLGTSQDSTAYLHKPHRRRQPVLLVTEKPSTSALCVRCHK